MSKVVELIVRVLVREDLLFLFDNGEIGNGV